MRVRELIELLASADPNAYVVNGTLAASMMPEITEACEISALCKTRTIDGAVVRKFLQAGDNADCKMVILR